MEKRHYWYKLDENKKAVPCDFMETKIEDISHRRVALDSIGKDVLVSTVFLCSDVGFGDGPPMLFETYVELSGVPIVKYNPDGSITYGRDLPEGLCDGVVARYPTWDEAKIGHDAIFALAKQWYESKQKEK